MVDESRIHVGSHGRVLYLKPDEPIECTVVEIRVNSKDWQLYAKCDDGSGDTRWFRLDEIQAD